MGASIHDQILFLFLDKNLGFKALVSCLVVSLNGNYDSDISLDDARHLKLN